MALRRAEPPAVHTDVVSRWIGFDPHLANRVAIDGNAALLNQLFRCASRSHTGLGEDFLETDTRTAAVHASMFSLLRACEEMSQVIEIVLAR